MFATLRSWITTKAMRWDGWGAPLVLPKSWKRRSRETIASVPR
ncbi:MAG TPA: hypothetical protein VGE20_13910 [Ramlibacter sp.]